MPMPRSSIVAAALLSSLATARADMGRVIVDGSDVRVSESAQKALVLHNRHDEILILGTEIGSSAATSILRFIPFPTEPKASLAPADTFDRLGAITAKYRLRFATRWMTKAGASEKSEPIEVLSAERIGAHDLTTVHIRDVAGFRAWIDAYLEAHGLPRAASLDREEAVVADYVRRGHTYFVLDRVDLSGAPRFVEPIAFRFESPDLYYPLVTSNSFGGEGAVELFVVAPLTLCRPGSNDMVAVFKGEDVDRSAAPGSQAKCLDLDAKASTSARLVPEEGDLDPILPDWRGFFGEQAIYLQAIRRVGPYRFETDVHAPLVGEAKALEPEAPQGPSIPGLSALAPPAACTAKPERGPCKAAFEAYWFDAAGGACKPFLWGGCGEPPPFRTLEDCERTCRSR